MPLPLAARVARGLLAGVFAAVLAAQAQQPALLAFDEALQRGIAESPGLVAQRRAAEAAAAVVGPARQLPDPKLAIGIDNLPVDGPDRFSVSRDFMTMRKIGLMQDFPRAEKRQLRAAKAQADADKENAMLIASSVSTRRDVALAWLDAYFAQEQLEILAELVPQSEALRDIARAQLAGGKGTSADPIAAQAAVIALKDRTTEAERNLRRARAALARWIGADATRPLAAPPDLHALAHPPEKLLAGIEHHPELAIYAPLEAAARADAALAHAAKKPDWSVEAAYAQRGSAFSNMASVTVRIDLPLWPEKRQDPLILAREKLVDQVRASREDARRMHEAEVHAEIAGWESAKERVARIEAELIPLAKERTAASLAAYSGGRGDLNSVLLARSNEVETRITLNRERAELGRAWASLNFLLDTHKDRQ